MKYREGVIYSLSQKMIERLSTNKKLEVFEFIKNTPDKFNDFYITINKNRILLNNLNLLNKILKKQICYGLYNPSLKAMAIIYKEKGYRAYLKLLASDLTSIIDLLIFIGWNHNDELYVKIKRFNPIKEILQEKGFYIYKNRGREILLKRNKRMEK